jgi:hypothetical protein
MLKAEAVWVNTYTGEETAIRDNDGVPIQQTRREWLSWAKQQLKIKNFRVNRFSLVWSAVVVWMDDKNSYKIIFSSEPQ